MKQFGLDEAAQPVAQLAADAVSVKLDPVLLKLSVYETLAQSWTVVQVCQLPR